MNRMPAALLRCVSYLLLYPSGEVAEDMEAASEWIRCQPDTPAWRTCKDFLDQMRLQSEIHRRELYSRTFDIAPETCLNLSYHRWGTEQARREALISLSQAYSQEGYTRVSSDLPDYLPMVLELLSVCREETARWIMHEYAETVSLLATRLRKQENPYAPLFEVILGALCELKHQNGGDVHA